MKVAVCTTANHIEVQEWPLPEIDGHKVLVKVIVCGVCGSDLAAWQGSGHKKYPYSPGHEFCGIIEKKGEDVADLFVGQRVVVNPNLGCGECRFCRMGKPNLCDVLKTRPIKSNGGFSEYVALDQRMVRPLPELLEDDLATFVEPLSCALYTTQRAKVKPGEQVVIFGAGLMGLLAGITLKCSQAKIVFVEPAEERRQSVASLLGMPAFSPSELARSDLVGKIDVAIDHSGSARAIFQAIKVLRKAGRMILAGLVMNPKSADIELIAVTTKELEISGVWLNPDTFDQAIRLAVEQKSILQALKTEVFKLDEIKLAFERALSQEVNKVFVKP